MGGEPWGLNFQIQLRETRAREVAIELVSDAILSLEKYLTTSIDITV